MNVIFHPKFYESCTHDPAASPGRMEAIVKAVKVEFEFVQPEPASGMDLERVHGKNHIQSVKREPLVYEIGLQQVVLFYQRKWLLKASPLSV